VRGRLTVLAKVVDEMTEAAMAKGVVIDAASRVVDR
jgi:hypothetical protein